MYSTSRCLSLRLPMLHPLITALKAQSTNYTVPCVLQCEWVLMAYVILLCLFWIIWTLFKAQRKLFKKTVDIENTDFFFNRIHHDNISIDCSVNLRSYHSASVQYPANCNCLIRTAGPYKGENFTSVHSFRCIFFCQCTHTRASAHIHIRSLYMH